MNAGLLRFNIVELLKKWWCSLLLLPLVIYSIHQIYWTLTFNIFFAISYKFPFPLNIVRLLTDNFLLLVHEAGHTFLSILGNRTITIMGGSLFEILLPVAIVSYFRANQKMAGMQLALYLTGCSLMRVSFYAADAGARQLPLIGGLSKESHDWFNLLSKWNLLAYDYFLGTFLACLGILCFMAALCYPLCFKRYAVVKLNLNI